MSPSSVVHAASLAKQVTALSVMLLARDGKLSLDDDVRRWLPELASNGAPITVRQLLGHTSGLRDFFERSRYRATLSTNRGTVSLLNQPRIP